MTRFACFGLFGLVTMLAGCEEVGPDADCFAKRRDEESGNPRIAYTCEEQRPCDGLELLCPGADESVDCGPDSAIVENPEALTCILDALVDGDDATVSWSATAQADRGWASRSRRLWIRGDRGYIAGRYSVDLNTNIDGVRFVQLRSKSDFERCRDAGGSERLRCVMDPYVDVLGVVID